MKALSGMKRLAVGLMIGLIGLTGIAAMAQDEPAAEVNLGPNAITISPALVGDFDTMTVRIVAPNGDIVLEGRSLDKSVSWSVPGDAENGWYNYEAVIVGPPASSQNEGGRETLRRTWGQFRVEDGLISVPPSGKDPASALQFQQGRWNAPSLGRFAAVLLDWLIAPAMAQDLVSSSTLPSVFFDDTNDEVCSPSYDWRITTSGGASATDINNFFQIVGVGEPTATCALDIPIIVLNHDGLNGATSSSINSIVVPANGDVNLANGSVYVDRSVNRLGVGTTTPVQELHIQNSSPGIRLDDPGVVYDIQESADDLSIFIVSNAGAGEPTGEAFTLEDTNGFFGIWQPNPSAPLHVQSPDGMSAQLIVENTLAPTATAKAIEMFRLVNKGPKAVRAVFDANGSKWALDNNRAANPTAGVKSGRFQIWKIGSGLTQFTLDGFGHGRFAGKSFAVTHVNTSSRTLKAGFTAIDRQQVLDRLATVPITRWHYRTEGPEEEHVGPVAEDFRTAFGVGDGEHIATVDADGVAFAAIQGLYQLVQEQQREIAALKQEHQALRQESAGVVAALAARLEALEMQANGKVTPATYTNVSQ